MKPLYLEKYPNLFKPLVVGRGRNKVILKNRLCVGPMGSGPTGGGADSDGRINDYGIDFYTGFAQGDFASVCLPMEVQKGGAHPGSFDLNEENLTFMNFHLLQRSVHAYNALTFAEIENAGPATVSDRYPRLGPVDFLYNGNQVRAMAEADMEHYIELYANYAKLARRANFDGILLHFANGYMMHHYLSPVLNKRTDEYGGSVENRCRFPMRVLKAIREAVGDDLIVSVRMNAWDGLSKPIDGSWGITPEDAALQIVMFQEYIDMAHVYAGNRIEATARARCGTTHFSPYAELTQYSARVKKNPEIKIPIGTLGAINFAPLAERIIAQGEADYIVMGRQALADNQFVRKVREGREDDIRPCLRCCYCMDHGRRKALTTKNNELVMAVETTFDRGCVVNPLACQGASKKRFPAPERVKDIVVIGGGIAGMQAALSAANRGHRVKLYEKTGKLGGQTLMSDTMWFKKDMKRFHEYMARQVRQHANIEVTMNFDVTPQFVEQLDPDAVIVAVGAEQVVPSIKGIEHATLAFDVFGKEEQLEKNVLIVGGGSVGCELSIHLSSLGHNVRVIEMSGYLASNAELTERMAILLEMEKCGVKTNLNSVCTEILPDGVRCTSEGEEKTLEAGSVVICVGTRPRAAERDQFAATAFDVINVGDCVKASNIANATETGWNAGAIL